MAFPEQRAIIAGVGISRIGRRTGVGGLDLTLEAARAAIADAGLQASDIDGIATLGDTPIPETANALGIPKRDFSKGFDTGGLHAPVMSAAVHIGEGRARHLLVYRTVAMIGGSIAPGAQELAPGAEEPVEVVGTDESADSATDRGHPLANVVGDFGPLMAAHAYSAANWLAMTCQRHMHLYGTTKEQLGWLAVNTRRNAGLNPRAVYRDPMTLDDYLASRPISTPFSLFDCDVPVDGSIALVLSVEEHATALDHRAVRIEAFGGASGAGGWFERPDFPCMASVDAAQQMWSRTNLRPSDVDVAELYDGFTFLTFAWLEALGLCGEGEAGPFVEGATRIALDGELPLNTYGGQLSAGRMHGYWVLHEACVQIRGEAGDRQVAERPEVAVASNGGGPIAGCMLLTS